MNHDRGVTGVTAAWRADPTRARLDLQRGLDFQSIARPEDLGLDPTIVFPSSPSGGDELRQLLQRIGVGRGARALDIGCGKGSAIRTMLRFPFDRVDGLEVAPELAAVARSNFARLHERRSTIFTADATRFDRYRDYDFLYIYSPFAASVMARCMARVVESVDDRPRTVTILYLNTCCHDEIVATGRVTFESIARTPHGNDIKVYRLT
ncbi:MAG: class I SAM-dependent methyltransferase [Acidimicrobiia bacterium]|nr:class I SAM-dependent methyltransferase [Acidimicrobiia bacterium]